MQIENGFVAAADGMHVRGPMIFRVDHDPKTADSQGHRHTLP